MRTIELWGLGLILVIVAALAWQVDGVPGNPHDFAGQCEGCHLNVPQQRGEKMLFSYDIDFVCRYCHEELKAENSHPSLMIPSMKMPQGFPLDWQGRMTCATCHDPHVENWGVNRNLLRGGVAGREFCTLCHDELKQPGGLHLIAEMVHSRKEDESSARGFDTLLDPQSQICITCHDGTVGKAIGVTTADERTYYRGRSMSHPIGFDYAEATSYNKKYRPLETLPPVITLVAGKVGCCSCHNPFSHESAMLVMPNRGSALCLACHNI